MKYKTVVEALAALAVIVSQTQQAFAGEKNLRTGDNDVCIDAVQKAIKVKRARKPKN